MSSDYGLRQYAESSVRKQDRDVLHYKRPNRVQHSYSRMPPKRKYYKGGSAWRILTSQQKRALNPEYVAARNARKAATLEAAHTLAQFATIAGQRVKKY